MARIDMSLDDSLAEETLCQIRVIGGEWPVRVEVATTFGKHHGSGMLLGRVAFEYNVMLPRDATSEQCRDLLCRALADLAKQIKDELWCGWDAHSV